MRATGASRKAERKKQGEHFFANGDSEQRQGVKECTKILNKNGNGRTSSKDNNIRFQSTNSQFICMLR